MACGATVRQRTADSGDTKQTKGAADAGEALWRSAGSRGRRGSRGEGEEERGGEKGGRLASTEVEVMVAGRVTVGALLRAAGVYSLIKTGCTDGLWVLECQKRHRER
jgi:hypothetical protein